MILVSVGLLLGFSGCDNDKPGGSDGVTSSLSEWPLQVGDWWKFERIIWDYEGQVTDTTSVTVVEEVSVLGGHAAYRALEDPDMEEQWLMIIDGELRVYEERPADGVPYNVLVKEPLRTGTTWQFYSEPIGGEFLTATITSSNATVQVPAGRFSGCVRVQVEPFYDSYFHIQAGLLKTTNSYGGIAGVSEELIDYHLVGQPSEISIPRWPLAP